MALVFLRLLNSLQVLEKPGDQDMRNKLMTNMKSITEEMGDEFPQLNKEMNALGGPSSATGNTKTPTKGITLEFGALFLTET